MKTRLISERVSKFSRYFNRSPDHLGLEDVNPFQFQLVATGISWPELNQIVCALRFFFGVTLSTARFPSASPTRESDASCPSCSADEVVSFLEAIPSLKSA